ncbi:hypothetical protein [Xenorhabdus lircayensis]|uniref:Uncharacterized protein n=1 Tax=Xenorhabdus lircayensis TaxID=2763499 RepID=A0ABS0U2W9_9GAMM|nr:hypothetical protein [Xenorhabdus lircayensis]MBI6547283.1 hypothetical protein [Xenorhabdus lircayensis]
MRLVAIYPDSYVFEEPHRKAIGKNRLTILCHGIGFFNKISKVSINSRRCNPVQLAQCIRRWTEVKDLYNVRLVSCRTANFDPDEDNLVITPDLRRYPEWTTSFGSQLSLFLPNVFVRAHMGIITSNCGAGAIWRLYSDRGCQVVQDKLVRSFWIKKRIPDKHYHCVVFLNGRFHKQSYNPNTPLEF